MFARFAAAAAPLLLLSVSAHVQAAPPRSVTPEQMRPHIEVLASDAFEGRKPGTPGETKTLGYIAGQLAKLGLEPAGENGSWYQPVPLVRPQPFAHRALFEISGRRTPFEQDEILLVGRGPMERVADAPVWIVGSEAVAGLAKQDLRGAVVLLLPAKNSRAYAQTAAVLQAAGALAAIGVLPENADWDEIKAATRSGRDQLQSREGLQIQGAMPMRALRSLVSEAQIASATSGSVPVRSSVRATLEASTQINAYTSHNVIGRLRGTGKTGESVVFLGHWDHLGICRPEGVEDRICNGAVDNASGIAMLIEIARNLARGKRPERDVLFMGTTAEEMGLLGAEYFGAHPTVPLKSIVAAVNVDTVAIHHSGEPVAIIGKGTAALDRLVEESAAELGRKMDNDAEADAFVQRQDGWVLTRAGVPTVMVGGSFSNMKQLNAFLSGPYHKPEDDLKRELILDGAAEDADLMILLGRKLADPKVYQPPQR